MMDQAENKVEIDIQKHVLTQSKKLSDGSTEKIFSRNPRNDSGMFTYNCHLCSVASLPGERALQTHITGKKHQQRLIYDFVPDAQQFRTPIAPVIKPTLSFYPGEPAPPGFEDEVETISQLEISAKKYNKPLIGLEYVVELFDQKLKEPFYICTLCDKRCDPRNILPQITSHRHRMKYLDTHFPSIMSVMNRDHKFNVDMGYREEVLSSIAHKIEEKFRRTKPKICDYREYERKKSEILQDIKDAKHYAQKDWPDCEKILLNATLVKKTKSQEFETVSSESDNEFVNDSRQPISMASRSFRKSRSPIGSRKSFKQQKAEIPKDVPNESRKILTHRELMEQSNAKMKEKYTIEKYKASVEIAVKVLEKNFKEYEKSPEKHPLYSDEWKAFWSRRYKELIGQGKNANEYDYKPEWIEFWTKRMKQLHDANQEKIKIDWRKKLGLRPETVKMIEESQSASRLKRSRSRSPSRTRRKRSISHETISDDSDDNRPRRIEPKHKRRSEERSRSRFSDDSPFSRQSDYRSRDTFESNFYSSRTRDYERNVKSRSPEIVDDGPVNLISVCRLLSALESELGLLAKIILDLLTKAVSLEKLKPNSADELLMTTENCNVLETVKEKLKGVLTANLIPSNKIIAVKRGIQNIATLLHENSNRKPSTMPSLKTNGQNQQVDDVDPVVSAKLEIAKVITASLLEQGRTDVSAEELEALVESFMESNADPIEEEPEIIPEKQETVLKVEVKAMSSHLSLKNPKEKESSGSGLENLTDEDLQTLLRNFGDLTPEEQSHLIAHLTKIEQTNPTRVEKLRKYVNIGDNEDIETSDFDCDDRKSEINLDMDFAAGIVNMKPRKKSPEPLRQELSDDDYDDDAMAKNLGMKNPQLAETSKPKVFSALKDSSGLADSLMSSLMQSSMPVQMPVSNNWDMGHSSGNIDMSSAYYQQPMAPYHNMMGNMPIYDPQMYMGMPQIEMQMQGPNAPWPQNAASNFYEEIKIPKAFTKGNQGKSPYRSRNEHSHNRQLTGKKMRK